MDMLEPLDARAELPRRSTFAIFALAAALWCAASLRAFALDPNLPPGGNFDLSHWHLTLPDSSATTIPASKLTSGYTNAAWFYTGDDGAMVFWCPVTGGTTANSSFPRSELRELLDPADNSVNWSGWGVHQLDAQCRILQIPSNGKVVIGQIHAYISSASALVLLKYDNGLINAQIKHSPDPDTYVYYPLANVALGELITYQIKLVDGLVSVTLNGSNVAVNVFQTDPAWTNHTFYFKAGSYCQDNSGNDTEGSKVAFYQVGASHAFAAAPPVITTQPVSQSTNLGANVSFRALATGTPPLFFQWRKDGVELPGYTNSMLSITNVSTNDVGSYFVLVTNEFGSITSAVATLSLPPPMILPPLTEALDTPALIWTTNGSPSWFAQTNVTHDGTDAAQSGAIGNSKTTLLQTTVKGPGTIAFWWKVSSEPSNDRLLFYIGSSEKARISGEVDWQWKTFSVSSGTQTLKWTYSKNSSKTNGADCAWLDQVMFVPDNVPTAPTIVMQPADQNVQQQATVTFTVSALGSKTLTFQWQCNGTNLLNGGSVSGATSATLKLASVQPAQSGLYSVIVSNSAGAITSSNAILMVAPIVTLADALDTPGLIWTTSSSPSWRGQTNVTHDGTDAARIGPLLDDQSSSLQTTVTGPGTLKFWWKVSSEPDNDRVKFYVNGYEQARISGEVDWEQRTFNLSSGSQALKWKYSKDGSVSQGQDSAWVDQVEFAPVAAGPSMPQARRFSATISISNGTVLLIWPTVSGKSYRVFYKDDLTATEWDELSVKISITGSGASVEDTLSESGQRFYRIVEE